MIARQSPVLLIWRIMICNQLTISLATEFPPSHTASAKWPIECFTGPTACCRSVQELPTPTCAILIDDSPRYVGQRSLGMAHVAWGLFGGPDVR